jgi:hypothetical protein
LDLYAHWLSVSPTTLAYIKNDEPSVQEWKAEEAKVCDAGPPRILQETLLQVSPDVKQHHVQRWLTIQSDKMEAATTALQLQIREAIWKPVLSRVMFGKGQDASYMTYSFHLDATAEDVFALWMLRVLKDFKAQGLIRSGCWIV